MTSSTVLRRRLTEGLVLAGALTLAGPAAANSHLAAQVHLTSIHVTGVERNEENRGLGLVYSEGPFALTAGGYQNSFDRQTFYAGFGRHWRPGYGFQVSGYLGVITGYWDHPLPGASAQITWNHLVLSLMPAKNPAIGFGLQLPLW
jgi:hypothetical protein